MCDDFFEDFDEYEDVEDDNFMDEDQCEDEFDSDTFGDEELDEPDIAESDDDFTAKDAFFLGGAMGWAYGEGFQDAIRQRRMKKTKKKLAREDGDR